jgi:hypothetical protein
MSLLPSLPGAGRAVGRVLRNPGVQAGIGTAVGMATFRGGGQATGQRRRRKKGISATELKAFTRVTGVLNKYCKTPPPMKRRTSGGRKCR